MLHVTPLALVFTADRELRFPHYAGASWRSALGATLRRSVCITGSPVCDGCPVRDHCAYGQWFEPPAPEAAGGLRLPDSPRGYVLAPLHQGGRVAAGTPLHLELTAIGRARAALPAVLACLPRLVLHGVSLRLVTVQARLPESAPPVNAAALRGGAGEWLTPPACPPAARITFTHPLRLQQQGQPIGPTAWTPAHFITALSRRVVALAAQFDTPLEIDHRALIAQASTLIAVSETRLRWQTAQRVSKRHAAPLPLNGLIGEVEIAGDLRPVWPLLWAGQWVHVGKAAVMGLGRYRIDALDHLSPDREPGNRHKLVE